jgi:hypothetical protein
VGVGVGVGGKGVKVGSGVRVGVMVGVQVLGSIKGLEVGASVEFEGVIVSVTEHASVISRATLKIKIQITNPFFLFMSIIHLSYLGQPLSIFLYLYGYDDGV